MIQVDDVDWSIIRTLNKNSRLSVREVSRKTGVPLATVNRRLRKLKNTGVIKKFTLELDPKKIGRMTTAYIMISCTPGADYYDVMDEALKHDAVVDIAPTTGTCDIILKVCVKDTDELSDFIFESVRNFPSVAQTETLLGLKMPKRRKKK